MQQVSQITENTKNKTKQKFFFFSFSSSWFLLLLFFGAFYINQESFLTPSLYFSFYFDPFHPLNVTFLRGSVPLNPQWMIG